MLLKDAFKFSCFRGRLCVLSETQTVNASLNQQVTGFKMDMMTLGIIKYYERDLFESQVCVS